MDSHATPLWARRIHVARVVVGWCLTVAVALAFAFAVYIMTQVSPFARAVAAFLVIAPLIAMQYLAFLILRPPPAAVRSSIREDLSGIIRARPVASLMRPGIGNIAIVCSYVAVTLYLNTPFALEGMDDKSVVVARQIPIALQMPILGKLGILQPLIAGFGEYAAYAVLVMLGALLLYLAFSVVAYVLVISLHSGVRIVLRLARWYWESLTKGIGNSGGSR